MSVLNFIHFSNSFVIEQIVSEINEQNDSKKAQAGDFAERKKIYEEKLNAWRKWDEARQSQLDSKIDDTSAKLQDLLVEIKYEAELLDKSWKDPKVSMCSSVLFCSLKICNTFCD